MGEDAKIVDPAAVGDIAADAWWLTGLDVMTFGVFGADTVTSSEPAESDFILFELGEAAGTQSNSQLQRFAILDVFESPFASQDSELIDASVGFAEGDGLNNAAPAISSGAHTGEGEANWTLPVLQQQGFATNADPGVETPLQALAAMSAVANVEVYAEGPLAGQPKPIPPVPVYAEGPLAGQPIAHTSTGVVQVEGFASPAAFAMNGFGEDFII